MNFFKTDTFDMKKMAEDFILQLSHAYKTHADVTHAWLQFYRYCMTQGVSQSSIYSDTLRLLEEKMKEMPWMACYAVWLKSMMHSPFSGKKTPENSPNAQEG